MKIEFASSKTLSSLGVLAGLVLSPLLAPVTASTAHQGPDAGKRASPDSVWSNCPEEITVIGKTAASEIRRTADAGIARIVELDGKGADFQEISKVGFRTVQLIVSRAGEARTAVQAHFRECLSFVDQFAGPADLRLQIAAAARSALREIDATVDQAVEDVHSAVLRPID